MWKVHTTLLVPYNISTDILKMPVTSDTKPAGHLVLLLKAELTVCAGAHCCSLLLFLTP